ncbi:MAG: hypothetical protein PSX71_08765 [bacterium]|nr:hypothetical protein [bacterium]
MNQPVAQFKAGKTYQTRSACDHNCIITVTVDKRTAKTITTRVMGEIKTLRIGIHDGAEFVKPWGSFSMSPIVKAA